MGLHMACLLAKGGLTELLYELPPATLHVPSRSRTTPNSQPCSRCLETGQTLPSAYGVLGPNKSKGRRAGIVLHPTCLPGAYGIGTIGSKAFKFVDWMQTCGFSVWQVGCGRLAIAVPAG